MDNGRVGYWLTSTHGNKTAETSTRRIGKAREYSTFAMAADGMKREPVLGNTVNLLTKHNPSDDMP